MLGTSLVNLLCKEKKGLVKEMTVRSSRPAPRAAATKRQDGVLSQIQLLRVPAAKTTLLCCSMYTPTLFSCASLAPRQIIQTQGTQRGMMRRI